MKKIVLAIVLSFLLASVAYAIPPLPGGNSNSFSVTDISDQTDDTTPATTATAVLAQGGSLIESTLGQIWTAIIGADTGITASKPVCTSAGGVLGVCAGTEGVWQVAGSYAPSSDIALTALANQAANTVLMNATADAAAPTAEAIAEARVLGRLTGENIKGLTGTEIRTLAGAAPAAGSTSIVSYGPTALQEVSCAANALTLTPTASLGIVNVSVTQTGDANCAVTMAETGAVEGTIAIIKNVSDGAAETLTFTTSAGVLTLIQGSPFAMGVKETLILQYKGSEWLEIGRASATINVTSMTITNYNLDTLSDTSSPHTLTAAEVSGTIINNYAATPAAAVFNLPAAAYGYNTKFILGLAQNVTIDPNASEVIFLNGTALTGGHTVINTSAPAIGDSLVCHTFQYTGGAYAWACDSRSVNWVDGT